MKNNYYQTAFLSFLNDIQSVKKKEYLEYLKDENNFQNFIISIENRNELTESSYPKGIENLFRTVIKKYNASLTEGIPDKNSITDNYISAIEDYQNNQIQVIKYTDDNYPQKLLRINNPPYLLYCKGDISLLNKKLISIIGTRNISEKGRKKTIEIVDYLVKSGYSIVSGLANGTDSAAHNATLLAGGKTIAVLPGSVTKIVPPGNRGLAEKITQSGLILSEITEKVTVHKGRFIERNRITSGLSGGVVVIESGEKGGSVRQTEIAIEQGIPVFAVKPDEDNKDAYPGYKKLLSLGAVSVESADQIIEELKKSEHSEINKENQIHSTSAVADINNKYAEIFNNSLNKAEKSEKISLNKKTKQMIISDSF